MREQGLVRYMSGELWKSEYSKPKVWDWIVSTVEKDGKLSVVDALDGGAFMGNCDQGTVKKYLAALTSKAGPLKRDFEGDEEYLYLKG